MIVRGCCSCCARLHGSVICHESSSEPGFLTAQHDPGVGMWFQHVFEMQIRDVSWVLGSVPLSSDCLGLRSSNEAEWRAAWCRCADASAVIQRRHSAVGDAFDWSGVNPGFHVLGAIESRHRLGNGFNSPQWSEFVLGEHL